MPTGSPLRLPPPTGMFLGDPMETDSGGLLASSRNVFTSFGRMESRPGPQRLGQALTAGEPVLGGFWTRDQTGVIQLVAGTNRRWWHYNNTSRVWDDLNGGTLLTGSDKMPLSYQYWEEGNFQYILGCNDVDPSKEWQVGAAAYAPIATGYIAKSICAVANRVFYGNVTIGGIRFPTMVAWSATGTRGTNPAGARNKLIDSGDHIVAVRRGARLAAYIYRERSIWVATAVAGTDAAAFRFDVADQKPGPVGPMAVSDDPGFRQYYFGSDLNIYQFDGTQSVLVAATCDLLKARFNSAVQSIVAVAFDAVRQQLWISLPLDGEEIPTWILVYSFLTRGCFFLRMSSFPITSLATWQSELDTATHLLPDIPTHTLPDVPTHRLGFTVGQEIVTMGTVGAVYTLDATTDVGLAIQVRDDVLLPMAPGGDHVFDGVEVMAAPPGALIEVQVRAGPTFDTLTNRGGGFIDPAIVPPAVGPVNYVAGGPNLSVIRLNEEVRARVVMLRFIASTTVLLQIRRVELFKWDRRMAA